ncbi:MAG: adenylate/guanylate cyclase domain-containing protein, partial [Candidatus Sericytochromatia bacterium]
MKSDSFSYDDKEEIKKIINAYDRFVPFEIMKLLGKNKITDVKLGDHIEIKLTILFSDIRNFTTLSESITPAETFNFINSYFSKMEELIENKNGIIDKYIGDAIMALFPKNADEALECSISMINKLNSFNQNRIKQNFTPIKIGIGLNTGICILGTVGGINRMEGTVISDSVNLASRLESLTKKYGVNLIISEHTLRELKDINNYSIRFLDRVLVKGKIQPQSIYEVYDNDEENIIKLKDETKVIFEEALAYYHYKKIDKAKELLEKCIEINSNDNPAKLYLKRCDDYIDNNIYEGSYEITKPSEWSKEYELGNKDIDSQHKELFEYSYKLLDSVNNDLDKNEIDKIRAFLDDYVIDHFMTEEKEM